MEYFPFGPPFSIRNNMMFCAFSGILVSREISHETALQWSFWNWKLFCFLRYLVQLTKLHVRKHCVAEVVSALGEPWIILLLPLLSYKHTAGGIGSGHIRYHITSGRGMDWTACSNPLPFSPKQKFVKVSTLARKETSSFFSFSVKGNWKLLFLCFWHHAQVIIRT